MRIISGLSTQLQYCYSGKRGAGGVRAHAHLSLSACHLPILARSGSDRRVTFLAVSIHAGDALTTLSDMQRF